MKKRRGPLKWIYAAASVIIMAIIFLFSSQAGEESTNLSKKVLDAMKESGISVLTPEIKIQRDDESATDDATDNAADTAANDESKDFNLAGRKWGHVYLYAALGAAVALLLHELFAFKRGAVFRLLAALISTLVCFVYACADEFHQKFVEGRTGQFSDVRYDAIGFGAAILFVLVLCGTIDAFRRKLKK